MVLECVCGHGKEKHSVNGQCFDFNDDGICLCNNYKEKKRDEVKHG
jgi:hypothetical protein